MADKKPVVVIGGGPAGSVSALCLRKLGHDVVIFEKEKFPRYRIGESLLPGTMSILTRLGVFDRIEAAGFVKKPAATFLWGDGRPPWSFTFSTPKTNPWVYSYAMQVNRDEYDQILLDAAVERGAVLHENYTVLDVEMQKEGGPAVVSWRNGESEGRIEADFVIDASGQRGVVATKYKLRKFDEYYRNMAVWSYWKGGKRYGGDLNGVTFSIAFKEGWIWMIPLKDDIYSVGVVTGVEAAKEISADGPEAFYRKAIAECEEAVEVLGDAHMVKEVRVVRDWAYSSNQMSVDQAFLCGDAACFIDPLFSQGVHLATYSAMLASAGIDYLYRNPGERDAVHAWYSQSYRDAYQRYHRFLTAFYACTNEPESTFWKSRKITDADDERLQNVEWFAALTNHDAAANAEGIREIEERAGTLAYLWRHNNDGLHDDFDEKELSLRRVAWANELVKSFKRCTTIKWKGGDVRLVPSYKVHTTEFHLEPRTFLGDAKGRALTAIGATEAHRQVFARLENEQMGYRELSQALKEADPGTTPLHLIGRLFEEGFIEGFDREGKPVKITSALRFGGVGAEDDFS